MYRDSAAVDSTNGGSLTLAPIIRVPSYVYATTVACTPRIRYEKA